MAKRKKGRQRTAREVGSKAGEGGRESAHGTGEGMSDGLRPAPPRRGEDIPRWVAPVLYAVVTLVLFRKFVFSGDMLFGSDTLSLGYVARAFYASAVERTGFPFWNPVILGGTPFIDSLAGGDSLYPTALLLFVMEPFRALGWKLVVHVFAAGLFMYAWVRSLGVSRGAALLSGLAYLMAPFMVTLVNPGHDGKLFVTALTPLAFWTAERTLGRNRLRWNVALAAVIALVILTTHFQMAYFLFGALGVYYLFRVIQIGRVRGHWTLAGGRYALFLATALFGAGVSAIQLIPAVEYVTEFSRRTATTTEATPEQSLAYSSQWSLHPEEAMSFVVPEFVGNNVQDGAAWTTNTYWGRNFFKNNHEYAGLVVLLMAMVAFFGAPRKPLRIFFAVVGLIALAFALGRHTPIWRIFYEVFPGISLFRAPSMVSFLFGFAAITLMAFGVDRLLADDRRAGTGPLRVLGIGAAALLVLTFLAGSGALTSIWTSVLYSDIDPAKADALARAGPFITRGFFIATLLTAASA
jgi:hypothetical protein